MISSMAYKTGGVDETHFSYGGLSVVGYNNNHETKCSRDRLACGNKCEQFKGTKEVMGVG